ncbi:MAG: hypothetical protein RB292_03420 [Patescibacteria group bacterium]|jgi:hypothetical protein|nr:hypothetical protein [Patescibacteria group bacterium]
MKKFFLFSIIFGSWLLATPVWAATVFSPVVELTGAPGETLQGVVKLYNETDEDLVLVSSIEAFTSSDEVGTPIYLPPDQRRLYLDWFTVPTDSILLQPRQVAIVPFTVSIPAKAVPGGYYAVIFWQQSPDKQVDSLAVNSKVGTLIFLKVEGDLVESGEVLDFAPAEAKNIFWELPLNFLVRFANNGNIHQRPTGVIELRGWFGQLASLPLNPDHKAVLPDTVRRFEVAWGSGFAGSAWQNFWLSAKQEFEYLAVGKIQASLTFAYGSAEPVVRTVDFWFIPWRLLSVVLLLLVGLIVFLCLNKKIKKIKHQPSKRS